MNSRLPLKSRFDEHLSRKFFHIFSGTLAAYLYGSGIFSRGQSALILLLVIAVSVPLEFLRFRYVAINDFVFKIYGPLMRRGERERPSGQLFYVIGLAWAVFFLPKAIALQAILTLAWMDPIAAIFGVRFGRITWNAFFRKFLIESRTVPLSLGAKTVEGSAAGFLAAFLAGAIAWTGYWAAVPKPDGTLWWPSALEVFLLSSSGALAAVVAESWPSQWDDNTNIPFWSGIMVWAVAVLLGIPL